MQRDFQNYCERSRARIVHSDQLLCEVELPAAPAEVSKFLAESPLPTPSEADLFRPLREVIDGRGYRVLQRGNWQLTVEPLGGIPPTGGMLRLKVRF